MIDPVFKLNQFRNKRIHNMEIATCPHCSVRVAVASDGSCPSCLKSVAVRQDELNDFADNPYESPSWAVAARTATDGMTTGEKIYTACVILCTGFFLLSLASLHLIVIPRSENPDIIYLAASIIWLWVLGLSATTAFNLYHRSLLTIPTVVQCFLLCFGLYFIPFGIWGSVLLYSRLKRAKTASYIM